MIKIDSNFVEIPLTKGRHSAKVSLESVDLVGKYCWYFDKSTGYAVTNINGKKTYMHRLITGAPKGMVCDHINRDKLDNRLANLQVVTQFENAMYQVRVRDTYSKYYGVTRSKTGSKWRSRICVAGVHKHIGRFNNRHDAALAYNKVGVSNFRGENTAVVRQDAQPKTLTLLGKADVYNYQLNA